MKRFSLSGVALSELDLAVQELSILGGQVCFLRRPQAWIENSRSGEYALSDALLDALFAKSERHNRLRGKLHQNSNDRRHRKRRQIPAATTTLPVAFVPDLFDEVPRRHYDGCRQFVAAQGFAKNLTYVGRGDDSDACVRKVTFDAHLIDLLTYC
jgi:hypothetical protein